jgi:SAM-dependent methyltransferase
MRPTRRLTERRDLAGATGERWRPPLHVAPVTRAARLTATLRRGFDLQAASIWRDLATELPNARGVVLDVGSGAQPYRPLLSPGAHYIGIDTVLARSDFGYEVPDTVYFEGETWPIESGSVDLVLCTETLEHVLDPSRLLDEAHRCLRRGGRLLLTVPFAARWHFIPHDYWRFTPSGLKYLLELAGFAEIRVYARGNELTVACYKVMALMLPLVLPQSSRPAAQVLRLLALPLLPLILAAAAVGRLSLLGTGGDDCLGYTVIASRPELAEAGEQSRPAEQPQEHA